MARLTEFRDALENTLLTVATGKLPDGGYINTDEDAVEAVREGMAKVRSALEGEADPLSPELRRMVTKAVARVTATPARVGPDREAIQKAFVAHMEAERREGESEAACYERLASDPEMAALYTSYIEAPSVAPVVEKVAPPEPTPAQEKMESLVAEHRRNHPKLSREQAFAEVISRNPHLYPAIAEPGLHRS